MIASGISILILLIPFQIYFNIYKNITISVCEIIAGIVFIKVVIEKIKAPIKNFSLMDLSVILFIFVMFLSITVSDNKINSLKYCIKWSSYVLMYFIASYSVSDSGVLKKFIKILFYTAAALSIIGFFEYYKGAAEIVKLISKSKAALLIMEPDTLQNKLTTNSFNWLIWHKGEAYVRVFSTFVCVITFSAYLGLIIPFIPSLISEKLLNAKLKKIYIAASACIFLCLFLTFTRSAYISFVLVFIFYLIHFLKKMKISKILYFVSSIIILSLLLINFVKPVKESIISRFQRPVLSHFDRTNLWEQGLNIFYASPLLGSGIANYNSSLQKIKNQNTEILPSHNQYIQIVAETGILGFLVYISIIILAIKYSFIVYKNAADSEIKIIAAGFCGMWLWYCFQSMFNVYLFDDKFSMMFWLMTGFNFSLYKIYKNEMSMLKVPAA